MKLDASFSSNSCQDFKQLCFIHFKLEHLYILVVKFDILKSQFTLSSETELKDEFRVQVRRGAAVSSVVPSRAVLFLCISSASTIKRGLKSSSEDLAQFLQRCHVVCFPNAPVCEENISLQTTPGSRPCGISQVPHSLEWFVSFCCFLSEPSVAVSPPSPSFGLPPPSRCRLSRREEETSRGGSRCPRQRLCPAHKRKNASQLYNSITSNKSALFQTNWKLCSITAVWPEHLD